MARLGARGRTQVYRVERRRQLDTGTQYRETLALMSDNVILTKVDFYKDGKRDHGGSWTRFGTLKEGVAPAVWLEHRIEKGWVRA